MKKIMVLFGVLLSLVACHENKEVHLLCRGMDMDYNVNVVVRFLDDGALLNIDGQEYELKQQYDARAVYYRFDPWYNLQIGNRDFATKYSLGVHADDGTAEYTMCEEID